MRGLGYRSTDVLVVAACTLAFVAVVSPSRHEPKGPPIALIAQDLGTTPDAIRHAADRVGAHPRPGHPPSQAEKQAFAAELDVSVEQLEAVMEKYQPDRLRQP
jgi:hypothetical protein